MMISGEIFDFLFLLMILGLSSSCSISSSLIGQWIQPGLTDLITINHTWFSLKGTCLTGQQDVKNKYLYYNEQNRCKRCILFIPRHSNALQYRESECFDVDDDYSRICASITPDTVLYTLFRDHAQSIPCPFDRSWYFKKTHQICQPKAFDHCSTIDTFQISYHNQCEINQNHLATCFAQFSDGNRQYFISRSLNQKKFICFSYTRIKTNETIFQPREVYFSEDETCQDLFTRESALILQILHQTHQESKVLLPDWTHGMWLSIDGNTFSINRTGIIAKINDDYQRFLQIIQIKYSNEYSIRLRTKSLEQCSSKFYCIRLIYRSSTVIDLSIGSEEYGCKETSNHYTLFQPSIKSEISCPQIGIYRSLKTYRSPLPVSTCSIGFWTLSIGCDRINTSELILSASCRHETVPEVEVMTSIKGICLASWYTDHYRFQRTLVFYEKTRAFCLIQPLKPLAASWILSESSCSNIPPLSINMENVLRYSETCSLSSSSIHRLSFFLFYSTIQVLIYT